MLLAGAAILMLSASCQREELQGGSISGEEVTVSISAVMPDGGSAVVKSDTEPGNGSLANRCIMQIYYLPDGESGSADPIPYGDRVTVAVSGMKALFPDQRLVSGHDYRFVFWADCVTDNSSTDVLAQDLHYDTEEFPIVSFKEEEGGTLSYSSNDDTRDAFFAAEERNISGPSSLSFDLKRPFGQLNIITTDWGAIPEQLRPSNVKLEFKSLPNSIDLVSGEVTGSVNISSEVEPVSRVPENGDSKQLSFDYIFAKDGEQTVLADFTMDFLLDDGTDVTDPYTFTNIPVQRNYQTNVSGNLLTDRTGIDVEVVPDFNEPDMDKDAELMKLLATIENGGEYTLQDDIEITEPLVIDGESKTVTVKLNGFDIINTTSVPDTDPRYGNTTVFQVSGSSVLNIEGEGNVHAISSEPNQDGYRMAVYALGNATVNIYGGNFFNDQDFNNHVAQLDLIYADQNAEINIYGGRFESGSSNSSGYWVLNLKDKSDAAINVYGGTFVNFDPSSSMTENPVKNFVADGYSTVKVSDEPDPNGTYVVVKDGEQLNVPVEAGTPETFVQALASAAVSEISVESNLSITEAALALEEGAEVEVNLNGHTLTFNAVMTAENASVTFTDGTIVTKNLAAVTNDAFEVGNNGSLTLDGITFESNGCGVGIGGMISNGSITVRNSTMNVAAYAVATNASLPYSKDVKIVLENSTFTGSDPVLVNIPADVTIKKCSMTGTMHGMILRGGNANVEDCTITLHYTDDDGGTIGDFFNNANWGTGNMLNIAGLTVGNKLPGAAYQYPSSINLVNTVVEVTGPYADNLPAMYVWANEGDGLGVTITYDGDTKFYGDRIYGNNGANITVNGAAVVNDEGDTRP